MGYYCDKQPELKIRTAMIALSTIGFIIAARTALGLIASASTIGASGVTLAKEKHHLNGNA
jgi:hypothetical protein